jgi:hypothetical protein
MHYSTSTALVAAFATLAIASPVEIEERSGKTSGPATFRINQVTNGIKAKTAPAIAMLNTYAKYSKTGAQAPVVVKKAAAAAQTGTVVATPEAFDMV